MRPKNRLGSLCRNEKVILEIIQIWEYMLCIFAFQNKCFLEIHTISRSGFPIYLPVYKKALQRVRIIFFNGFKKLVHVFSGKKDYQTLTFHVTLIIC